tara:strand:- start:733 stop:1206 length:474 start_codon:yes stop_codon:yes gene_type:complete
MIEQIYNFFSHEMLFYWTNLGIIPLWIILIFFPQSHLSRFFVTSVFPIFILSAAYIFLLYKSFLGNYDFVANFNLYLGIAEVSLLFENETFLLMFWVHFISINLFTGGWIVKDSHKYSINKILLAFPLIMTYFVGPLGLFIYWLIRIFYAKNINLYD